MIFWGRAENPKKGPPAHSNHETSLVLPHDLPLARLDGQFRLCW